MKAIKKTFLDWLQRTREARTRNSPSERFPKLTSVTRVEKDRIVGFLAHGPGEPSPEEACADAIATIMTAHGFRRSLCDAFDRSFEGGSTMLQIGSQSVEGGVAINVRIDVTYEGAKQVLDGPGLAGLYPSWHATMEASLQRLAAASPRTGQMVAAAVPGPHTFVAKTVEEARQQMQTDVAPLLPALLGDRDPWFQHPRRVTELYRESCLVRNETSWAFEFVCKEDLILTQAFSAKDLRELYERRRRVEEQTQSGPWVWGSPDRLDCLYDHILRTMAPDAGLPDVQTTGA